MFKRVLAIALAVCMFAAVLAGCGQTASGGTVNFLAGPEPQTIDPGLNNSADGGVYILHAFEGLTRIGKDGRIEPGMAEKWDVSEDGTKYTFHLRDAKWSDGKPVTAQDFEYAWKRVLAPKVASPYANQLYYLKNGEAYNMSEDPEYKGTKAKAEDVGVKARDEKTLEVELNAPTAYFLDLTNFYTYMPLRKDIIEKYGDQWTQKAESFIGNGAFKMVEWKHNDELVFEKSESYWDKEKISLKQIHWKLMEDDAAALSAFDKGELDGVCDLMPVEETQNLIKAGKLKVYDKLGTYYLDLNVEKAPLDNPKVRKALALAIDRQFIVDSATKAGEKPAVGFIPFGVAGQDAKKDFRTEIKDNSFLPVSANAAEAQKLLSEAGFPGGKDFPELEIITVESQKTIMEAVQSQWNKNLGINVKISTMEGAAMYDRRAQKDYMMSADAWIGDYNDPMTFMDLWAEGSGNNDTGWANKQYDGLVDTAKGSMDAKVRMKAMHDAEKLLMDEMPVIPVYYYTTKILQNPKLKGMLSDPRGFLYLHYAQMN